MVTDASSRAFRRTLAFVLFLHALTAVFFLGIHLPGWYSQGRLLDTAPQPIGDPLSIFIIGWALGLVAYRSESVARSTLTRILNNLFSAAQPNAKKQAESNKMRSFGTAVVLAISVSVRGCEPTPYRRARVTFGRGRPESEPSHG